MMIRTPFCDLIGIDIPLIQAPMAPWTTPELVAAVSNAGALGSCATGLRTFDQVRDQIDRIRELTDRPFAVNFLMRSFDQATFEFVMTDPPPVVSFAAGAPLDLMQTAKAAGSLVFAQVNSVEQAHGAVENGADVLIAQGAESGGLTGEIALMPLLPQVVDAVSPVPVIASGGIADGRGMAAALMLGASGVNLGTRFLASVEASLPGSLSEAMINASSGDTVRATIRDRMFPPEGETFPVTMRSLKTPFLDKWENAGEISEQTLDDLRQQFQKAASEGRIHEYVSGAGQSVGLVTDIALASDIVRAIVSEAERVIERASRLVQPAPDGGATR
jgi:enoyl-[acyl-carrier protein] reductase II